MKKFLPSAIAAVLLLFFCSESNATHLMGADLTYECIGPGQYRLTLKVYRDCRGISVGNAMSIPYRSTQCGVSSSVTLQLVQGYPIDITPTCPGQSSRCSNGNLPYGVQEWVFQGVVTLPPGCGNDWVFGWSNCCRNNAINTLNGPGNQDMAVFTTIDNTLSPCNSSPIFSVPPVPFTCINQPVFFNPGGTDIEGDSLAFEFAIPQQSTGNVTYAGGFGVNNPLTTQNGITINPANGDVNFTPTQLQVAVIAVRVKEYRNGQLISTIVRDIQYTIINCNNQNPTVSGINGGTTTTTTIFAGQNICFNMNSADNDANDNVSMTWNASIPGATFTTTPGSRPVGQFCWQTTQADTGTHIFTVTVKDDNCPITGQGTRSFTIIVLPCPQPPAQAGPDVVLCPGQTATLTGSTTAPPNTVQSYVWSDGVNTQNGTTWNVNPQFTTVYTFSVTYTDGCVKTDQVVVTRNPKPNISVYPAQATICAGGSIQLTASSNTGTRFRWFPSAGLSCDTCRITVASPSSSTIYSVFALDNNNCPSDTITSIINSSPPPPPQACAVIYATLNGTGDGSQANPTNLKGAIAKAQCNNSLIKLAQGNYVLDSAIYNITSYTTIEGGFDPVTWEKRSAPGLTTIRRTCTNVEGPNFAPRVVLIYMNSSSYFRFQDLTFQTDDCPPATAGNPGISNYVFHLANCSDYDFVRCQIIPGKGGDGFTGTNGLAGANGGIGLPGTNGDEDNTNGNGNGGNGGNGGGVGFGTGGGGGAGAGAMNVGADGASSSNLRAGGGGGGGGSGGTGLNDGRAGGRGGTINNGPLGAAGGAGGAKGCNGLFCNEEGEDGLPGADGSDGSAGTDGTQGAIFSVQSGFFVPGANGTDGTDGSGGTGGGGGGGGGGEDHFVCAGCIEGGGAGGGGGGGGGEGGAGGTGGTSGGASFGVYLYLNGNNGRFDDCFIAAPVGGFAGTGGLGGLGGAGGAGGLGGITIGGAAGGRGGNGGNGGRGGNGGNGWAGSAMLVYNDGGSNPSQTEYAFTLGSQPTITVSNTNCTFRDITFSAAASNNWNFGNGGNPQTGSAASVTTQYTTFGRKDIAYGANNYTGFTIIPIDANSYVPDIATTAQQINNSDTFIICQFDRANFTAVIPAADSFLWDFGGAVVPNTFEGPQFGELLDLQFNTAGTFKIKVRVSTSCCGYSPFDSIYLIVEPTPVLGFNGFLAYCPGDSATITATGASFYLWNPPSFLSSDTGATVVAKPPVNSTYVLTGFSPNFYCSADTVFEIQVRPPPQLSFTTTPATCGPNGTITAIPNPTGNFTYQWQPPITTTDSFVNGVPVGGYTVTVTDNSTGCTSEGSTIVGAGAGIIAYIDSLSNVSCAGFCNGTIRVVGIGGSGNFTYLWNNGSNTNRLTNVCPGDYEVTITDNANGCTATAGGTISEPLPLELELLDTTPATCFNVCDGTAFADAVGGTGLLDFIWDVPGVSDSTRALNLCAGPHRVYVIDQNNCVDSLDFIISSPPPIVGDTLFTTPVTCPGLSDGSAVLTVNGGVAPYSYNWLQLLGVTDSFATNLSGGSYVVVITDATGCTDTVLASITELPPITGNDSVRNVSCFGGNDGCIYLNVAGGTPPYTYIWSDTSTSSVSCGLSIGSYDVTITDANGCTSEISNIQITQPTALIAAPTTTPETCPGFSDGTISANPSGGTPGYNFTWNPAASDSNLIYGQPSGFYDLTVTDANNCSFTVNNIFVDLLPEITILPLVINVTCPPLENGAIYLAQIGGVPPVTYQWSNGGLTDDITNLPSGEYSVTVNDSRNCATDTSLTVLNDSIFKIFANPQDTSIFLGGKAQINVSNSPGTVIQTISYRPPQFLSCNNCVNPVANPIKTILYEVTATDTNGCIWVDTVNIEVVPDYPVYIPNAFSPGTGDNRNEFFEIFGNKEAWKQMNMKIFNRWGEKVYESSDKNFKWDGTHNGKYLEPGVLVYILNITWIDNHVRNDFKGSITILR